MGHGKPFEPSLEETSLRPEQGEREAGGHVAVVADAVARVVTRQQRRAGRGQSGVGANAFVNSTPAVLLPRLSGRAALNMLSER